MVSGEAFRLGRNEHYPAVAAEGARSGVELRIDGSKPLTMASVAAVEAVCARVESHSSTPMLPVRLSGAPSGSRMNGLDMALVTKWERALRRLERLDVATVAVATDDCGGTALDLLLAADYRIATQDVRLSLPVDGEATWPGMAIFRLAQQIGGSPISRAILFGGHFTAQESLDLGIIDEVADDPAKALDAMAEVVSTISGSELAIRRQLMFDAATTSFDDALGRHLAACERALRRSVTKTSG